MPIDASLTGSSAALGHTLANSIPLSIFPIALDKFCFCFCGLPGRGKTHIATRLRKYLEFFHAVPVKLVNTANYRRLICGSLKDADWFDPGNMESKALRDSCNDAAIIDTVAFLNQNVNGVVVFDSTNVTHARRKNLYQAVSNLEFIQSNVFTDHFISLQVELTGAKIMFIEVTNENVSFLNEQYHNVSQTSFDYQGVGDNESVGEDDVVTFEIFIVIIVTGTRLQKESRFVQIHI